MPTTYGSVAFPWAVYQRRLGLNDRETDRQRCPLCEAESLTTYNDVGFSGKWCWCKSCNIGMDALDLCLVSENVSLGTFLRREASAMQADGDTSEILLRRHYRNTNGKLNKAAKLLNLGAEQLGHRLATWPIDNFRSALHLRFTASEAKLRAGRLSQLFMLYEKKELKATFGSIAAALPFDRALAIPFFSAPRRLSGLLVTALNGETQPEFLPLQIGRARIDPGLANIDAVLSGESVVALDSWWMYLRMQTRELRDAATLAPFCLFQDIKPGFERAWDNTNGGRVTFWAPQRISAGCLRRAKRLDAKISDFGSKRTEEKSRERLLRDYPNASVLRAIGNNAASWQTAADRWLSCASHEAVQKLLERLDLSERESLRNAVRGERKLRISSQRLEILVGSTRFQEREDGLYVQRVGKQPTRIFDGKLRVTRIVGTRDDEKRASCMLLYDGKKYAFRVERLDEREFAKAAQEVITANGLPIDGPRCKSFPLLRAVCRLHPPKKHLGFDFVGWQPDLQGFQLPHNRVKDGVLLPGHPIYVPRAGAGPQKRLMRLRKETSAQWAENTPATRRMWALALSLMPACLARWAGRPAWNTLLVGDSLSGAFPAIVKDFHIQPIVAKSAMLNKDDWPKYPQYASKRALFTWMMEGSARGCITAMSRQVVALLLQYEGFCAVKSSELVPAEDFAALKKGSILPFFLRHCSTVKKFEWRTNWKDSLLPLAVDWLEQSEIDPAALVAGAKDVIASRTPEALTFTGEAFYNPDKATWRADESGALFLEIPGIELRNVAERAGLPHPERIGVTSVSVPWTASGTAGVSSA